MKELIDMLTGSLGVDARQAEGGAAVLFKAARDKLGEGEFSRLSAAVPGLSDLVTKAPSSGGGGLGGLLGGIAGAMGGNAALISTIVGGFGKLGLTTEDAKRFVPVILEFLHSKAGPEVVSRLEKALRA
ncbi:MAG TPA: DUF2780 domain-containing protein [Steroidobacteraceae bacterium]|jgi:hypothetical protein|nr:DUF2780 domain-containing protein [Steroidobacteraceae bacterium]